MTKKLDVELGFVGAGNMGEALMRGVIDTGLAAAERVHVSEKSAERLDH